MTTPAEALRAIGNGVRATRELVPSVQDLRAELRERTAELREQQQTRDRSNERNDVRRIETRIPDPSTQARNFINTLDDTAGNVQARLQSGSEARNDAEPAQGASLEVGGERFAFRIGAERDERADPNRTAFLTGARIDFRV